MIGLRLLDRALANQKHLLEIRDLKPGPAHAIERFEIFAQARSSRTETFNAVQAFAAMILSQLREHDPRNNEFLDSPALMPDTLTAFDQLVEALVISEPELAEHLHVSDEEILEAQELGQAYNLLSLDTEVNTEGERKTQTLADYIGTTDAGLTLLEDKANLERAFEVLSGRERVILYLRFYENVSQTEIAKRLNVSQMHVSRLQQKALEKLRSVLQE